MERALELARQCQPEAGRATAVPLVGAVAVRDGRVIAEAYRNEPDPTHRRGCTGDHAEYCMIMKLGDGTERLKGATAYTTLEPCTKRSPPKIECAQRLIDEGVQVVFVGMPDPDARVQHVGMQRLRDAGIWVRDFAADIRDQIRELNRTFIDSYRTGDGLIGSRTFDYLQNDGRFEITRGSTVFRTKWSQHSRGGIWAYGDVARLRGATEFDEFDDPAALSFGRAETVMEGQIVVFRQPEGFALVRVEKVLVGQKFGDEHTALTISWELLVRE
jgi:pyrimidine deaminase RibD-like protein